jgi:3',5'-cyclic AMP phosphodiesterase CpdA
MKTSICALRRVDKAEILLEKINEIIVVGDPGCTKFDDHSKRILGEILAKKADAFIVLGDMVLRGRDDELKEFTSFCNATTGTPVFTLCGNHDLPGYPAFFGKSTYALIAGAFVLIFVDNVTDYKHFNRENLEFIKQEFDKYPNKKFIILFHIPPPTDLSANCMNGLKWGELRAVLEPCKDRIECLICGHIHGFRDHIIDGYRVFVTGGGGAKLQNLEKDAIKAHHAMRLSFGNDSTIRFSTFIVGKR